MSSFNGNCKCLSYQIIWGSHKNVATNSFLELVVYEYYRFNKLSPMTKWCFRLIAIDVIVIILYAVVDILAI